MHPIILNMVGYAYSMRKGSTLFLKFAICLIAIGALVWLIWFPQTEGRAVNLDLVSIYKDPVIIYGFIASTPFFFGLYQAFKLLNFIDANHAFSQGTVNTLKNMKFASFSFIGFIAFAEFYLLFFVQGDDKAGPMALGIYTAFATAIIATAAAVFQRLLQNAVDIKSENDLTV